MRGLIASAALLLLLPLLLGCGLVVPTPTQPPPPTAASAATPAASRPTGVLVPVATAAPAASTPVVRLTGADGQSHDVHVEIVATEAQRERGLMQRTSMPDDAGMLFVFPADTDGAFWMKDTLLPLSIAFIAADGRVVNVQDMAPETTDYHTPGAQYRFALEVNQGYFARVGIRAGDRAQLPPLPAAS